MAAIDLDDTGDCPLGEACEHCGRRGELLAVATLGTPLGVYCATLCAACSDPDDLWPVPPRPRLGWGQAALRVGEHCVHLGIDLEQMADALAAERADDPDASRWP